MSINEEITNQNKYKLPNQFNIIIICSYDFHEDKKRHLMLLFIETNYKNGLNKDFYLKKESLFFVSSSKYRFLNLLL